MSFLAGTGFVDLTIDDDDFSQDVDAANARIKDLDNSIHKLTAAAAAMFVGGSLAIKKFVQDSAAAQEAVSKFRKVFKDEADATEGFVNDIASSLGKNRTELMGFLATLQDTFVPLGFARKEATKLSKSLTQLALDIASFNNQDPAEVIRSLQSALVGSTIAVRKYGIVISQAAIDQQLLNMGVEGGIKNATEAQKAFARYNIIMEGSADAQGDAADTADSAANQFRRFTSQTEELSEAIGGSLTPSVLKIVGALNTVIPLVVDFIEENPRLAKNLGAAAVGAVALAGALATLGGAALAIKGTLMALAPLAAIGGGGIAGLAVALAPVVVISAALVALWVEYNAEIDKAQERLDEMSKRQDQLTKGTMDMVRLRKELLQAEEDLAKTEKDTTEQARKQIRVNEIRVQMAEAELKRVQAIRDGIDAQGKLGEVINRQLRDRARSLQEAKQALEEQKQASKDILEFEKMLNEQAEARKQIQSLVGEKRRSAEHENVLLFNEAAAKRVKLQNDFIKSQEALDAILEKNPGVEGLKQEIDLIRKLNRENLQGKKSKLREEEALRIRLFTATEKERSRIQLQEESKRLLASARTEQERLDILAATERKMKEIGTDSDIRAEIIGSEELSRSLQEAFLNMNDGDTEREMLKTQEKIADNTGDQKEILTDIRDEVKGNKQPIAG